MLMVGNVCGFIKYLKRSTLICGKVDYLITQPTPNPYRFTLTLTKCCWDVGLKPLSSCQFFLYSPISQITSLPQGDLLSVQCTTPSILKVWRQIWDRIASQGIMGFTWRSTHQQHKYIRIKLNIFNFKQVEMQWETVMAGCLEFT